MRFFTLYLFFIFFNLSSAFSQEKADKSNYALLWEISGNGLEKPSYLFGTMHVRDMRAFEFPDSLLIMLDNCEAMATEIHFDSLFSELWSKQLEESIIRELYDMDEELILSDDPWLEDISGDSPEFIPPPPPLPSRNRIRLNKSRKGITNSKFDLLDLMFEKSEKIELSDEFLDAYLFKRAKNLGKNLYGLEEVVTQLDLRKKNYGIDTTMVDSLLRGEVPDISIKIDELYNNQGLLLEIYQQGNLNKVREFSRIFYGKDSEDRKEWLLDRNEVILQSMIEIMHNQSLFAAVGCAHLPDQGGLLELLEREGYSVRKVTPSFTGVAEEIMSEELEDIWVTFEDSKAGYGLQLPRYPERLNVMAGLDGWMCGDLINNVMIMNYGVPCALSGLDPDDPNIYDNLINSMKSEGRISSVQNSRNVHQSGVDGVEVDIEIGNLFTKQKGKLWLFTKEKYIYMFMMLATDTEELTDDQKLLKSIVFFPRENSEQNSDLIYRPEEGFSATMPGVFDYTEIFMTTDYSEPDFKMRQAQFVASDINDNSVRMIIKSDLPPGQYFDNDSIALSAIFEDPTVEMKYGEGYGKKIKLENGIVGFQSNKLFYEEGRCLCHEVLFKRPKYVFSNVSASTEQI